jgi:hypothetical protein
MVVSPLFDINQVIQNEVGDIDAFKLTLILMHELGRRTADGFTE